MTIRLNGEAREVAGPVSISALLTALDLDPRRVAVEHNLVVVRRDAYDSTIVSDGDEIEVVNFVGGGGTELRIGDCGLRNDGVWIADWDCGLGLPIADWDWGGLRRWLSGTLIVIGAMPPAGSKWRGVLSKT